MCTAKSTFNGILIKNFKCQMFFKDKNETDKRLNRNFMEFPEDPSLQIYVSIRIRHNELFDYEYIR